MLHQVLEQWNEIHDMLSSLSIELCWSCWEWTRISNAISRNATERRLPHKPQFTNPWNCYPKTKVLCLISSKNSNKLRCCAIFELYILIPQSCCDAAREEKAGIFHTETRSSRAYCRPPWEAMPGLLLSAPWARLTLTSSNQETRSTLQTAPSKFIPTHKWMWWWQRKHWWSNCRKN